MKKNYKYLKKFLRKPEGFFAATAIIAGGIFAFIIPPLQTPDEYVHFYRAYEVSELKIPQAKEGRVGSYLPLSIDETESVVRGDADQLRFKPREKYNPAWAKGALVNIPLDQKDKIFYDTSGSPLYFPLVYVPQAVVVGVARMLESPVILMLYLVRIVNLLIWVGLAYVSIKIFPWKKWALVGVCLLPIMVSQSISPGLDVIVYGCALLFASIIFSAFQNQRTLSRKQLALLLVTGVLMTFGKSVAAALLILVFLLRPNQLPFFKHSLALKLLIVGVPVVLYVAWSILTASLSTSQYSPSSDIQINTLFNNPLVFIASFFGTFLFIWGDPVSTSFIGNFGWLDTPLAATFVNLGYIIVAALLLINYEKVKSILALRDKILLIGIITAYFIGTYLAMYIYSTEPDTKHIIGVQGRYFIPLLFLLIPLFYSTGVRMKEGSFISFVKVASIFMITVSIVTVIFRYYIVYF